MTCDKSGIEFVRIEPGTFTMGSPKGEVGRGSDERQREVTISAPYWLAKCPVTNAQYRDFVEATGHRAPNRWDDAQFSHPDQPVVGVSWWDASEFCRWIEGRLPTEAQWEYACRAGTTTPFAIGDGNNISSELANFDGNCPYGDAKKGPSLQQPSLVGTYEPNAWGLHDMHGNVWEWCLDWYGAYQDGNVTDPEGPMFGAGRLLRGGAWSWDGRRCRSASRFRFWTGIRIAFLGFRPSMKVPNEN